MEYLMTYGWAILVVAIILIALFQLGIFGSQSVGIPAGACQVYRPYGPGSSTDISIAGMCKAQPKFVVNEGPVSSGSISLASSIQSSMQKSQELTITAWVQERKTVYSCNGSGVGGIGATAMIFETSSEYFYTGGCFNLGFFAQGQGDWSSLSFPHSNHWYFVAVEYNGTSNTLPNLVFYLNTQSQEYSVPTGLVQASTGAYLDAGFNGSVANVQIYNTSLSTNEINALYMEGIGGAPIDPVHITGWWSLNGNVNDYSGEGNSGYLAGGVGYSSLWHSNYTQP